MKVSDPPKLAHE